MALGGRRATFVPATHPKPLHSTWCDSREKVRKESQVKDKFMVKLRLGALSVTWESRVWFFWGARGFNRLQFAVALRPDGPCVCPYRCCIRG